MNFEPHGLYAATGQWHSEEAVALPVIQDRYPDKEFLILLGFGPRQEGSFLGSRGVWNAQQMPYPGTVESHGSAFPTAL
jgi:hypothetical protein